MLQILFKCACAQNFWVKHQHWELKREMACNFEKQSCLYLLFSSWRDFKVNSVENKILSWRACREIHELRVLSEQEHWCYNVISMMKCVDKKKPFDEETTGKKKDECLNIFAEAQFYILSLHVLVLLFVLRMLFTSHLLISLSLSHRFLVFFFSWKEDEVVKKKAFKLFFSSSSALQWKLKEERIKENTGKEKKTRKRDYVCFL